MTLVGAVDRSSPQQFGSILEVWLLSDLSPDEAITTVADTFIADDWLAPENAVNMMGGGFVPSQMITTTALCSPDDESYVWVSADESSTAIMTITAYPDNNTQFYAYIRVENIPSEQ